MSIVDRTTTANGHIELGRCFGHAARSAMMPELRLALLLEVQEPADAASLPFV